LSFTLILIGLGFGTLGGATAASKPATTALGGLTGGFGKPTGRIL